MQRSEVGRTAVHEACIGGHVECVTLLVGYTQDLDTPDKDGQTAAHLAAYHGERSCLAALASAGTVYRTGS